MRLLNWQTEGHYQRILTLDEFFGDDIPRYAILSHTWEKDEVLFSHIIDGTAHEHQGYSKIQSAVEQAENDGFEYIWIDTCCIDKSSSAELSEAINSMFTWYWDAAICYAYLVDVHHGVDTEAGRTEFRKSRWFTRGWCLQELVAPEKVVFFTNTWLATEEKRELYHLIHDVTGIGVEVILDRDSLWSASVAQRMSWASRRETTRLEDVAYSLMGLFSVNMPLLYGEGRKAFLRLQEEIMKISDDHSLFAWTNRRASPVMEHGLLADSPVHFTDAGRVVQYHELQNGTPYQMTNRGIQIDLRLTRKGTGGRFLAALDCPVPDGDDYYRIGIALLKVSGSEGHHYKRIDCGRLFVLEQVDETHQTLFVRQQPSTGPSKMVRPSHYLQLNFLDLMNSTRQGFEVLDAKVEKLGLRDPESASTPFSRVSRISKQPGRLSIALLLRHTLSNFTFVLLFGSHGVSGIGIDMLAWPSDTLSSIEELEYNFQPSPLEGWQYLASFELYLSTSESVREDCKWFDVGLATDAPHKRFFTELQSLSGQPRQPKPKPKPQLPHWGTQFGNVDC